MEMVDGNNNNGDDDDTVDGDNNEALRRSAKAAASRRCKSFGLKDVRCCYLIDCKDRSCWHIVIGSTLFFFFSTLLLF
jgi:hypothetical protein